MERMKAILTLTAALAFAASPLMTTGFAGFTPGQFPVPQVDPPAQPAGYAFSIWGLIYVWLIAGTGFGLLKRDTHPGWDASRWPLFASLVLGAAWIPVAQLTPVWATVMIWLMLAGAVWALLRAGPQDRWWLRTPIALYAGWLTAASCVALALVVAGYGIVSAQAAALTLIAVALVIALAVQWHRRDTPEYALAVIWALVGIVVANAAPANWPVVILCTLGIVALGALAWRGAVAAR
jgi:hypothetical protein